MIGLFKKAFGVGSIVLVAAVLAGCSESAAVALPALPPGADEPFDLLLSQELGFLAGVRENLSEECASERGYPDVRPEGSASVPASAADVEAFSDLWGFDESLLGPSSEEAARRSGFGRELPPQSGSLISFDPNYDTVAATCDAEVVGRFGDDYLTLVDQYFELSNNVRNGGFSDALNAELKGSRDELLDCFDEKGFRPVSSSSDDVGFDDFGVPMGALERVAGDDWEPARVPGTVEVGPDLPARRYLPTPRESEFAVAVFQCHRDLGIRERQLAKVREAQQVAVEEYAATFTELNPRVQEMARRVAALVGQPLPR